MDVNEIVAQNLKLARERKKLSLDQVAKLTGVSKSMLGQIERGEVNPTITVLWKIANGLKVSFTSLLDRKGGDVEVTRQTAIRPLLEDEGRFINYPVFTYEEERRFETYHIEILPGGSRASEAHLPGTEEYITLYSGRLNLRIGDTDYELAAGDSIRFKSNTRHKYVNPGDETAVLGMIIYYGIN